MRVRALPWTRAHTRTPPRGCTFLDRPRQPKASLPGWISRLVPGLSGAEDPFLTGPLELREERHGPLREVGASRRDALKRHVTSVPLTGAGAGGESRGSRSRK